MQLRKAARQKARIRLGFSGASGTGKTVSALRVAYGMTGDWDKIAIIDTENKSADLYANHTLPDGFVIGEFLTLPLSAPYSPERYMEAIKVCEDAGIEVLIIDSITHEWDGEGGILQIADSMTGNSFTNWGKLTPRHTAFINAILKSPCHVLTTVRRKQDYVLVEKNGKQVPEKVGLKEITREGFEYELTANIELDIKHNANAVKDRTGLFMGKPSFIPTEETGRLILEWCENGVEISTQIQPAIERLQHTNNQDELEMLIDTLPLMVAQDATFVNAVNERMADFRKMKADALTQAGNYEQEIIKLTTPDELTAVLQKVNELPEEYKKTLQNMVSSKAKQNGWKANTKTKRYEVADTGAQPAATNTEPAANGTQSAQQAAPATPAKDPAKPAAKDETKPGETPAAPAPSDNEAKPQTIEWFAERIGKEVWMQGVTNNPDHFTGVYMVESDEFPEYMFTTLQKDEGYTFRDLTPADAAVAAIA